MIGARRWLGGAGAGGAGRAAGGGAFTVHCDADGWDFDPRYSEGRCPICGRGIDIAPAAPRWLLLSRRVPWDVVFLAVLLVVLVFLGFEVARAGGLLPGAAFRGWPGPVRHFLGV